jgi:hypothetical protein
MSEDEEEEEEGGSQDEAIYDGPDIKTQQQRRKFRKRATRIKKATNPIGVYNIYFI